MQDTLEKASRFSTASIDLQERKPDPAINCPFLRMVEPRTSNMWRFIRDCKKNGLGLLAALVVGSKVVVSQKGWRALLRGEAPDLYRLGEVEGISHDDRYLPYLSEVKAKVKALSRDGQISLQELADIKEWIATQEGIPVNKASKKETVILFVRAGGDLDTGLVDADDVLRMIEGYKPKKSGAVGLFTSTKIGRLITWSDEA